jgi:hypothetical protein
VATREVTLDREQEALIQEVMQRHTSETNNDNDKKQKHPQNKKHHYASVCAFVEFGSYSLLNANNLTGYCSEADWFYSNYYLTSCAALQRNGKCSYNLDTWAIGAQSRYTNNWYLVSDVCTCCGGKNTTPHSLRLDMYFVPCVVASHKNTKTTLHTTMLLF